ncbi:MAG: BatA domain-containing protein [Candidatus Latescibacterota bacterium]|nr:BatA domain-containing protein [Candidatus Latescibacterota bacterium]
MQFLNPAVLAGLVAAALPLAIHLLHRGRARSHPFSDLAFLRSLHQNRMRRIQVRQWLVLLLRTLIVVLIVCAFARPTYRADSGWDGRAQPVVAHVLIDLSYSTRYRLPSGSLFAQLQNQVRDLLAIFARQDQVTIQPFARRPLPPFEGELEYLTERVAELAPQQQATDLRAALHATTQELGPDPGLDRELFLFTDLSRHNWDQLHAADLGRSFSRIYIAAPAVSPRPNAYVKRVTTPSWMLAAASKTTVQVELAHHGPTPLENATLDLFVAGERLRRQSVDLGAEGSIQANFNFSPRRAGRLSGHVELEDDALALDNRRYFTVDLPTTITTLLLGDRPDDTYYPRRALGAATLSDPAFEVRSGLFADLDPKALAGVDVVVLCNLKRLSAAQKTLLEKFVAAGGGLILFPGPQSDLSYYNRDLLPGLSSVRFKERIGTPQDPNSYQTLDAAAPHHPLFTDLLSDRAEDPASRSDAGSPRFFASFAIAPTADLQPLVRFSDGQLALALTWKDRGRVAISTFPLDSQWNDLHLHGLFAPLLHRLVRELSLPPNRRTSYLVGETIHRHLNAVDIAAAVEAETPSGERLRLEPERVGGQYLWKIPQVREAGIWHLRAEGETVDVFAVNLDTRESDLTPVPPERVRQVFGDAELHFLHPGDDLRLAVLGNRYGRELWREFLLLALALLTLEQWIARAPRDAQPRQAA